MGWNTFWINPCLVCYFIVVLFYIERKWLLMRNLATSSPLTSKLSGKFQCFNAMDGSIEMLKNRWISKNFNSSETFQEAQTASRLKEIIKPLPNPHHLPPIDFPINFNHTQLKNYRFSILFHSIITKYILSPRIISKLKSRCDLIVCKILLLITVLTSWFLF